MWTKAIAWLFGTAMGRGVLLGGIFMLTDYSTSPSTELGKVIFALGAGIITMLIPTSARVFGGGGAITFAAISFMLDPVCSWPLAAVVTLSRGRRSIGAIVP